MPHAPRLDQIELKEVIAEKLDSIPEPAAAIDPQLQWPHTRIQKNE